MKKSRYSVGIDCWRHRISVELAVATFCPDLAGPDSSSMEDFIAREHIAGGSVYVWNDIDDRGKGYRAVATIETYRSWTLDEIEAAIRQAPTPAKEAQEPGAGVAARPGKYGDLPAQLEIAQRFGRVMEHDAIVSADEYRSVRELSDPPGQIAAAVCLTAVSRSLPREMTREILRELSHYLPSIDRRVRGPVAALGAVVDLKKPDLDAFMKGIQGRSREETLANMSTLEPSKQREMNSLLDALHRAGQGDEVSLVSKCEKESASQLELYEIMYRHLEREWIADMRASPAAHEVPAEASEHRSPRPKAGCLLAAVVIVGVACAGVLAS